GAVIFQEGRCQYCCNAVPVASHPNPNGAGDTYISAFTLSVLSGGSLETAAELAGIAAGIGMSKAHTAFCSRDELHNFFISGQKYIPNPATLGKLCARYRAAGKRIVFTNGCFDILHSGHVSYLNRARELGDVLIVAVNNDESIRRLKGDGRPVNPLEDRLAVLSGLSAIDHLVSFGSEGNDTPVPLLEILRPQVFVKGGDYTLKDLPEAPVVAALGGSVVLLPYIPERSTTNIIRRIYRMSGEDGAAQPARHTPETGHTPATETPAPTAF
ncbi:MAG TPA: D-glycero-beta-D-manno-heptose 1-phosphate adenylyltransferase, partial [Chitinophaga sp.]